MRSHPNSAAAKGLKLIGVCTEERFRHSGGRAGLRAELRSIATALKFSGPIEGGMWDVSHRGWNTTLVECILMSGAVKVRIEDFSGQPTKSEGNPRPGDQKIIKPTSSGISLALLERVATDATRKPFTANLPVDLDPL